MISEGAIPDDVRRFVLEEIASVPHLEALLLLWEQPSGAWTEESLAHALYVELAAAKKIVRNLMNHSWVVLERQSGQYSFDPRWDPDGEFMRRLAHTYRTQLVRVATMIHSNASSAVRDFAKAFEITKKD